MTASARFLFCIVVLTLLGCTSDETPATDPAPRQEAEQEDAREADPVPPTSDASTDQTPLIPTPSVDPEKEEIVLLSPAELTLPTSAQELTPPQEDRSLSSPPSPSSPSTVASKTPSLPNYPEYGLALADTPSLKAAPMEPTLPETVPPETASPDPASMVPLDSAEAETTRSPAETESASVEPPAASLSLSPPLSSPPESHANPLREGEESDTLRPDPGVPSRSETAKSTTKETQATEATALLDRDKKTLPKNKPNSKGEPFDPIAENGPIFQRWPKPELVLLMTGRQNGYIEPCGCAGMERMKGGLIRRDTMIRDLVEKRKWPVVALDLGNQIKGHKRQTELKFQHTADSLSAMGYEGIGLGIADLQLPAGELAAITSNENSPFVSANIDLFEPGTDLIAKYRIIERNGIKVGVTAVLGNSFRKQLNNQSIPTTDPVEAIEKVATKIKDCEVRVLLAYADRDESMALAKRFPMFNVVVTAAGGPQPPKDSTVIPGTKTYLVEVGEKGECAIVLGLYRDRRTPVRYQRVTLDSRFANSEKIHRRMSAYQDQLKLLGFEGLNIKPVSCPEAKLKGKYVGSKACETCHEQSYDVWRKSKHAKAWKTLLETDPPRNHDPECISCHVIGWDPQRYYPLESGFLSSAKTPELENVGCESCHGPGGAHAKAEEGGDMELQERLQKAMIVTIEESRSNPQKMCYNCHDLDNSPEFDFDRYWPDVKHYETESGEKEEDE